MDLPVFKSGLYHTYLRDALWKVNSVDYIQTAQNVQTDLTVHCWDRQNHSAG